MALNILDPSLIQLILSQNAPSIPRTTDEWIIGAINYFHSIDMGGGGNLETTLLAGDDANGQNALNFLDVSLTGTLYDHDGLGLDFISSDHLNLTVGAASTWTFGGDLIITGSNVDMSAITSLTVGGLGVITDSIVEKTAGAGIDVTGTSGTMILMQNVANEAYIMVPVSTVDHACINLAKTGVDPTTPNEGDIWFDAIDGGFSFQCAGPTIHLNLIPLAGWTQSTVSTFLPGGLTDASTPAEVLRYLQSLENHLFTNMRLLQA